MLFGEFVKLAKQKYNLSKDNLRDLSWLGASILNNDDLGVVGILSLEIDDIDIEKLENGLKRLTNDEPLAYILGNVDFYGSNIQVNKTVLIPRHETEILCETIIKENQNKKNLDILDLCTGSGCIAITLAKELNCKVVATDISKDAIELAKENANNECVKVKFLISDMFKQIPNKFDIIVSNPPYIESESINTLSCSVKDFEPRWALDGGDDGLEFYRVIANNSPNFLKPNGKLYLEIGYNQGESVPKLLEKNFCDIKVLKDYDKLDRIIVATLRS